MISVRSNIGMAACQCGPVALVQNSGCAAQIAVISESVQWHPCHLRISVPKYPTPDPNYRILAHQMSRFTHYYFYIRDEVPGPIIVRVASFFPFHATCWLNGHFFIGGELIKGGIGFRKDDNAFLAVDDVAALQAAADRLGPQIIRQQLDYRTLIPGPKFLRHHADRVLPELIFKRHFPIHRIFERGCEIGLWRLTANRISEIFGVRLTRKLRGKLATVIEQIDHGHHVFRANFKSALLRQYDNMKSSRSSCAMNCYPTT